jgi:hypothetical protein
VHFHSNLTASFIISEIPKFKRMKTIYTQPKPEEILPPEDSEQAQLFKPFEMDEE